MRLVLRLPRRRARLLVPGARGPGRGPHAHHGRGNRERRGSAPGAGGLRRGRRGAVWVLHPGPHRRDPRSAWPKPEPHRRGDKGGARGQPLPVHRLREDPRRRPPRGGEDGLSVGVSRLVIENCAVATVDPGRGEHASGHLAVESGRIVAVGAGPAPEEYLGEGVMRIDGSGCLATPGLVNCHHHLYQWATRGLAQQATLFEWLVELYPVWALIDEETERAAARAGLAALALSGCTTTTDHHYVFPRHTGDLLKVEIEAARNVGLRFHPCRGSMDLGRSRGSMLRIALAPCSPFSVTRELMAETAELARRKDVRLHTHLAETEEEEEFCLERFGVRPVGYLEDLGWLGDDVWLAHCVHLSEEEV